MPERTYWKGYLKLSLVTCPVAMVPATAEAEKIRFHTMNRRTGNRIASRYVDSVTGKPVDEDDEAKAYQRGENDYVILEDEELESVALESTHTIDIDKFASADRIPWIYRDKPHYLYPNDEVGLEAFAVIREAMNASKVVGISRLVLYRRERAVMLAPQGMGIILWTLRYGDEVRDEDGYYAPDQKIATDPDLVRIAKQVIEQRTTQWSPDLVKDPVQETWQKLIASKRRKGGAKVKRQQEGDRSNVIDLFAALKKSLQSEQGKPGSKRR